MSERKEQTERRARDEPPGLRAIPLDMSQARQLTQHWVESTAVHSRSRGWIPMVKLDLHHVPLEGSGQPEQVLELVLERKAIEGLVDALMLALVRAEEDARIGLLPSGQRRTEVRG